MFKYKEGLREDPLAKRRETIENYDIQRKESICHFCVSQLLIIWMLWFEETEPH